MKRTLFGLLAISLAAIAHSQDQYGEPAMPCEELETTALMVKLDATAHPSHDSIQRAIDTAIEAHDCKASANASPQTADGNLLRAEGAVADDMRDPSKVRLLECTGIKVFNDPQPAGHPPSESECKSLLTSLGMDPSIYSPLQ